MSVRDLLRSADQYLKAGDKPNAIEAYLEAIEIYRSETMWLKALAITRQILAIDPDHAQARTIQQDLATKLGITL